MGTSVRSQWAALGAVLLMLAVVLPPSASSAHAPPAEVSRAFYFHPDGTMTTAPPASREAVVVERVDASPEAVFVTPPLAADLHVAREGSFDVTLENRRAYFGGAYNTTLRLTLLHADGSPVMYEGEPVVLAHSTHSTPRAQRLPPPLEQAARSLAFVEGPIGALANRTDSVVGDNAVAEMVELAALILCGRPSASESVYCDMLEGDYGYGALRPCRSGWWAGLPQGEGVGGRVQDTGACSTYAARNATRALPPVGAPVPGGGVGEKARAVGDAFDRLAPPAEAPDGWTRFQFEITPHPALPSTVDVVIVPAGYRIAFEQRLDAAPRVPPHATDARAQPTYREALRLGVDPILDAVAPLAHARVEQDVAGRPASLDVNATHLLRRQLHDNTRFDGVDALLADPMPASQWEYGGRGAPSRLVVRTLVPLPEETLVREWRFDDGNLTGWRLDGLWHLEDGCLGGHSRPLSLQYNRGEPSCDYNVTGSDNRSIRNWGTASVAVDLRAEQHSATLRFAHRAHVEAYAGSMDKMRVTVACHHQTHVLAEWDSRTLSPTPWREETFDISMCRGGFANVSFLFDTVDNLENAYPGWAVDDVVVTAA